MSPALQPMAVQCYCHMPLVSITGPEYCTPIGGSSGHVIGTYILHIYALE